MSECLHNVMRISAKNWPIETCEEIHRIQSDPVWVESHVKLLKRKQLHELHAYRSAVRHRLRLAGKPVRYS